ncbi:Uu.00g131770.m01.CDS01 [Anthostomella pinea]|uniref:Uu.00g131770.m01.CDS01 n=1 Tax=Anthostomella pinea TaxID=933095 RepID=A0AAI8VIW0_9PEZI|nr:Uu.00g131770.m01.CDS01 [Anthostomella pinea]
MEQRKKMRSLAPDDNADASDSSAGQGNGFASDPINISSIENACVYLESAYRRSSGQAGLPHYLGYLRTSQSCRHIFYISPSIDSSAQDTLPHFIDYQGPTLQDLLMTSKAEDLTRSHQMRFALKAVLAVLKFHSTPWLSDSWKTSDLLLSSPSPSAPRHSSFLLRSRLLPPAAIRSDSTTGKSVTATQQEEDTVMVAGVAEYVTPEDRYGVYNKVLWSLGAALLEIGHWETFDRLRGGTGGDNNDEFNDILTARRLSKRKTMLGGKYDEIVRKCLRCDFGQGDDLGRRELEEAVYGNIVCPLQDSIDKMEELCI